MYCLNISLKPVSKIFFYRNRERKRERQTRNEECKGENSYYSEFLRLYVATVAYIDCFRGRIPPHESQASMRNVVSYVVRSASERRNILSRNGTEPFVDRHGHGILIRWPKQPRHYLPSKSTSCLTKFEPPLLSMSGG